MGESATYDVEGENQRWHYVRVAGSDNYHIRRPGDGKALCGVLIHRGGLKGTSPQRKWYVGETPDAFDSVSELCTRCDRSFHHGLHMSRGEIEEQIADIIGFDGDPNFSNLDSLGELFKYLSHD